MSVLDVALDIARVAHAGQTRRDGVTPYIVHPMGVCQIAKEHGYSQRVQAAALLHDALEDAEDPEKIEKLIRHHLPDVLPLVQDVTHREGLYSEYVSAIFGESLQLKLSDILYNMSDQPTAGQRRKYGKAIGLLRMRQGDPPPGILPEHWRKLVRMTGIDSATEAIVRETVVTILNH